MEKEHIFQRIKSHKKHLVSTELIFYSRNRARLWAPLKNLGLRPNPQAFLKKKAWQKILCETPFR